MILKAKERGDAPQIARYLLADRDNDHVELHELRGFASDDLVSAFEEAGAIASGTRCKNHLFSISLNPPEGEQVGAEAFERAIAQVEQKMGLAGQPRAIVFHEKDGRRHAHAVWSRIGQERMRAINLPHYKIKLRDVSRQLFLDHGWDMPRGLQDRALRDPLNFTRAEWQQAWRAGLDSREIKAVLRQCWNASDNRASLGLALKERGFWLARGDRRGFVAVDYRGEVYALARYTSVKTKDIEVRLGNRSALLALSEVKAEIAGNMTERLQSFIKQADLTTFSKVISKTRKSLPDPYDFDLTNTPDIRRRLLEIPKEQRTGPVIVMANGRPPKNGGLTRNFKKIVRDLKLPDELQIRDTRSGGITEAKTLVDPKTLQHAAQHTQGTTTDIYTRDRSGAANNVVAIRARR